MPEYKRVFVPGGTYFFTLVTYQRRPLFASDIARDCLKRSIRQVQQTQPFILPAICLLPDHLHCVMVLPEDETDFSNRWGAIKSLFSKGLGRSGVQKVPVSSGRSSRGEVGIWQRRYWEHLIRDEQDYQQHLDYIHFNPVKHGLVQAPLDWPWSSLHRYVKNGCYGPNWGEQEPESVGMVVDAGE
jgi:putative transposase